MHVSSVMSVHSATPDMVRWTCGKTASGTATGTATARYGGQGLSEQHNWDWLVGWTEAQQLSEASLGTTCHRDEWPPAHFLPHAKNPKLGQRIRFLPAAENGGAGQLWKGFCNKNMAKDKNGKKNEKVVVSTLDQKEEVTTIGAKSMFRVVDSLIYKER